LNIQTQLRPTRLSTHVSESGLVDVDTTGAPAQKWLTVDFAIDSM